MGGKGAEKIELDQTWKVFIFKREEIFTKFEEPLQKLVRPSFIPWLVLLQIFNKCCDVLWYGSCSASSHSGKMSFDFVLLELIEPYKALLANFGQEILGSLGSRSVSVFFQFHAVWIIPSTVTYYLFQTIYGIWSSAKYSRQTHLPFPRQVRKNLLQCCGSASIIMWIRIRDPKNVHMDPDPRKVKTKEEKLHKIFFN